MELRAASLKPQHLSVIIERASIYEIATAVDRLQYSELSSFTAVSIQSVERREGKVKDTSGVSPG